MSTTNNSSLADARKARGERIADRMRITRSADRWYVPSESTSGKYTVVLGKRERCSCPDFTERGLRCKHIWAVELTITRETNERGEVTETRTVRATYSQQWS